MIVTLRQLEYIVSVHELKSFSKAAEQCNAEQSTVSQQVKTLEDRLNVEIFNRQSIPLTTTDEGIKVILQAKEILDKVETLIQPFKASSNNKKNK